MKNTSPKRKKRTLLYALLGLLALLIVAATLKARQKPKGQAL